MGSKTTLLSSTVFPHLDPYGEATTILIEKQDFPREPKDIMFTPKEMNRALSVNLFLVLLTSTTFAPAVEAQQESNLDTSSDEQEPFAASSGSDDQAVRLYLSARIAYDEGRYQEAVEMLEEALTLDPDASDLYYNLALTYEHLQQYDNALRYLEQYLSFDIDVEERESVHRRMSRIRGAREHVPPTPEPEMRTQVVVQRFGRIDPLFWSMVGSTLVLATTAAITGGLAVNWEGATEVFESGSHGDLEEYQRWVDNANRLALSTDILIGAASATAIAALLLFVLRTHPVEQEGSAGNSDGSTVTSGTGESGSSKRQRQLRPPQVQVGLFGVVVGWEL